MISTKIAVRGRSANSFAPFGVDTRVADVVTYNELLVIG